MKFSEEHFNKFARFALDTDAGCYEFIAFNSYLNREKRIVRATYPIQYAGWYDSTTTLKTHCKRLDGTSGYVTFNPIHRDRLSQSKNDLIKIGKGEGTKKEDATCLRHFLVDIDVERGPGISSTAGELEGALELRNRILDEHADLKNTSIWGCSGNGGYILVALPDLANTPEHIEQIRRCVASLAHRYKAVKGRHAVHIDIHPTFANAHIGIPGTYKCKGSNTDERPWRLITVEAQV